MVLRHTATCQGDLGRLCLELTSHTRVRPMHPVNTVEHPACTDYRYKGIIPQLKQPVPSRCP